MSFNPLSGTQGSVKIGTTAFAFDEWKCSMKDGAPKVSNFTSGGKAQYISGMQDADITCSGPYDEGNQAFDLGTTYTLVLGYTSEVNLTVTDTLLVGIDMDVKVEDAQRVSLTFKGGTFTASIA
jgi:hypothetical protein